MNKRTLQEPLQTKKNDTEITARAKEKKMSNCTYAKRIHKFMCARILFARRTNLRVRAI